MPGSLVLWHVSKSSLGSSVIRTPTFGTTMPRKPKSYSTYMEMGSFPLLAAVSWNSWCTFAFSPSDGLIWGKISCLKKLWHIKVTWLPESSRDGIFFLPHPMFILGHVATALCITSILTWAETCWLDIFFIKPSIPSPIPSNQIVILVWTTDLLSIRLVQGLRNHYFFGTSDVAPGLELAFSVTCSWANSCIFIV